MSYLTTNDGQRLMTSDGSYLKVNLEDVLDVVKGAEQIPKDAKDAVKDFIETNFYELIDNIKGLTDVEIPNFILEKFPEFIEYIEFAFSSFL